MPYSPRVKALAYRLDPECWNSYSGLPVLIKRRMDARRVAALNDASERLFRSASARMGARLDALTEASKKDRARKSPGKFYSEIACKGLLITPFTNLPERSTMPPMKIQMMLHFAAVIGPYQYNQCDAYIQFVRELLRDGMIERPTKAQRAEHAGWAYKATAKGIVYVEALKAVPLPVQAEPKWVMPEERRDYKAGDEVKGYAPDVRRAC